MLKERAEVRLTEVPSLNECTELSEIIPIWFSEQELKGVLHMTYENIHIPWGRECIVLQYPYIELLYLTMFKCLALCKIKCTLISTITRDGFMQLKECHKTFA